ncbi:MAG: hypothetical protein IJW00_06655 [Clostridia bacterium]|nr:hypothetical protein [Clostridia bacterium]
MEISQKLLCFLFLASFAAGAALGLVYELLRLSRLLLSFPGGSFPKGERKSGGARLKRIAGVCLLCAEDLCFALLCGTILLLLLYFINDGQFRFISPLGMACGYFVFYVTLGSLLRKLSGAVVSVLHRMITGLLSLLWRPIRKLGTLLYRLTLSPILLQIRDTKLKRQIEYTERKIRRFHIQAGSLFGQTEAKDDHKE